MPFFSKASLAATEGRRVTRVTY